MKKRADGQAPEKLKSYAAAALKRGITDALVIRPSTVVTAPWVRIKCQFGCGLYGKGLCCPPRTPAPEQTRVLLDSYTWAILLHVHWSKEYKTVDSLNDVLVDMERTIFLDGFSKAFAMGSGPCRKCPKCNVKGECLHPNEARPAMEACGIDVFSTARAHGLPIHVVRNHGEERDVYGLVLVE